MDGRKILGVLRLRAGQLESVEYLSGASLRMTEINILDAAKRFWSDEKGAIRER